jgi:hypothetical protein
MGAIGLLIPVPPDPANRAKRSTAARNDAGRHAQGRFTAWDVRAD